MNRTATTLAAALAALVLGACAAGPQTRHDETGKSDAASTNEEGIVLLLRTPRHLRVGLRTAREVLAGGHEGVSAEQAHVVACGGAVPALRRDGPATEALTRARRAGVAVAACGLTLERKGLDPDALDERVEVVPNGLAEALRLQQEGFRSVAL